MVGVERSWLEEWFLYQLFLRNPLFFLSQLIIWVKAEIGFNFDLLYLVLCSAAEKIEDKRKINKMLYRLPLRWSLKLLSWVPNSGKFVLFFSYLFFFSFFPSSLLMDYKGKKQTLNLRLIDYFNLKNYFALTLCMFHARWGPHMLVGTGLGKLCLISTSSELILIPFFDNSKSKHKS